MADEDINPVVLLADPKVNHRVWAACLKWTPVVKKQRVPSHHKHKSHVKPRRLTSLKVTVGSRNSRGKISRLTGTGILTRPERNHYFSLALAFCSWVRNGYGVFRYSDKELLFLASINGQPAVMADLSGNDADVAQKVSLFLAMNEEPPEKWQVVSSLEHPDNWESIITRLSSADLRRCKLTVGNRSKFTLPAVLFLVAAGAGTVFWMTQPEPDVGPTAEEIAARARLQFKKPEPPPELPHPWASQPVISDFLKACADLRKPSPVALEGWKLTGGTCTPETFTLIYERQPGGTIEGFLARSKEIFNVIPDFNLKDGARLASVTRPLPSLPRRDEAVPAPSEQLMRVFTWFQKKQLTPAINEIAIPEPLPGNDGEPAPVQKWKEYQFSLSTPVNPDELFPLFQDTGVRLSNIHFELNGGNFSYSSEGHIYASR
ncbi:type 4b pilus protein PilO2 [Escherichia coli]|uniref:type 4b pilus protein PilO2 n=1 Tax=Escherichia coli TaxID=562 RepID=UPI0009285AE1|nr:type 4b pilus protein PilO2 [Escherichia coli]OJO38925.1 pilus assembly protein PilO [Escherichia coli]OJO52751.1 pilus assembly protein PilO [Escherichia coli]